MNNLKISIISPVYNEEDCISDFYSSVKSFLDVIVKSQGFTYEIVMVNDGSKDNSLAIMTNIAKQDGNVKIINLTRNFGQQIAISAGIDFATGDAVILMDADLQDVPEAIPALVSKWKEGWDVVYAQRTKRKEMILKRLAFSSFYKILAAISDIPIPPDSGIFGLMDRKVVDALKRIPERNRFLPGLRAWVGYKQTDIKIERAKRKVGAPRVSLFKLVKLALDGFFSFSKLPLRIATVLGLIISFTSFCAILVIAYWKFFAKKAILGWASTLGTLLLLGGVQLITTGIIGEYIGRIYEEVKQRPLYLVQEVIHFPPSQGAE